MRLTRVEIEGYRSMTERVEIHIDPSVTVLLGANDHGKTNILSALRHLNEDQPFTEDDLNWDKTKVPENNPLIVFHFELSDSERKELQGYVNEELAENHRHEIEGVPSPPTPAPSKKGPPPAVASPSVESTEIEEHQEDGIPAPRLELNQIPRTLSITRQGLGGKLKPYAGSLSVSALGTFLDAVSPRVEIIRPQEQLPDAVGHPQLAKETHEFMRGIFYYAALDPDGPADLFTLTDTTMMRLKQASVQLNDTLKTDWSQGKDLRYELSHDSKTAEILLRIEDPAVSSRLVRASHRSSGFTHFFALKTILNARQRDNPANSYIFLFDEPGIFLHPSGQYDLLQVLDAIGRHNQVIYSTHSLFMINKTFPARHRLIVKTEGGTRIDGKPFVGRWGPAIEELGLSLAGTILFAQHIVLAEGDSDPMLMQFLFQKLVESGKANIDLNAFSVISTGDSRNTDALIRIITEGASKPKVLVLVDGDRGGVERLAKIASLLDLHKVKGRSLDTGLTIEDYLPSAGTLYVEAAARYAGGLAESLKNGVTADEVAAKMKEAADAESFSADGLTQGIAEWALKKAKQYAKLKTKPSKIGIAREYIDAAGTAPFSKEQLQRALSLLRLVQKQLEVPEVRDPEKKVTAD